MTVGTTPVSTDIQCQGEPSDNTRGYADVQGAKPSKANPADMVTMTYGKACLWDFFLPPSTASELQQADVSAEIHSSGSHFPGTVLQPLIFSNATTTVGGVTGWFANPSSQTVQYPSTDQPCYLSAGTGASYLFAVWSEDQTGSCD